VQRNPEQHQKTVLTLPMGQMHDIIRRAKVRSVPTQPFHKTFGEKCFKKKLP
jgi:hypothetical protein